MRDRAWRSRLVRGAAAMAVLAVAAFAPSVAGAQVANPSAVTARPGELVRLRTAQWEYTGQLVRIVGDSAVLTTGTDSATIARSSVVRTEVQRGTHRSVPRILLMGLAGGAAASIIGGYAGMLVECGGSDCSNDGDYAGIAGAASGIAIGMVIGGVAGGIWGAKKRYPRWVDAVLAP